MVLQLETLCTMIMAILVLGMNISLEDIGTLKILCLSIMLLKLVIFKLIKSFLNLVTVVAMVAIEIILSIQVEAFIEMHLTIMVSVQF